MKRSLIVMLVIAAVLAACGSRAATSVESPAYYEVSGSDGGAAPLAPGVMPLPTMTASDSFKSVDGNAADAGRERLIIRNADLSLVVKDPSASMDAIAKMANDLGGFVVSSNLYQSYAPNGTMVPEASIVIRVPAEKLDKALETIKADATEVQNENISGQDVTSQYVDLESQLKNLEAAERQLTEIMDKAEKTEDVLNVYNQLVSIRGQIEQTKGQMKYFEEASALSSVSVKLVAEETIKPIEIGGWKPAGTVRDAIQNLITFSQNFVDFLIWFVLNFLPKLLMIFIVFVLPFWLIGRGIRNALRRRKARMEAPKTETK